MWGGGNSGWAGLTAVGLVLSVSAVVLAVAAQVERDALLPPRALELSRQADVRLWKKERNQEVSLCCCCCCFQYNIGSH